MEEELKGTNASKRGDGSEYDSNNMDSINRDKMTLNNLLHSLSMETENGILGGSGTGPVSNMLRDMGLAVPSNLIHEQEREKN